MGRLTDYRSFEEDSMRTRPFLVFAFAALASLFGRGVALADDPPPAEPPAPTTETPRGYVGFQPFPIALIGPQDRVELKTTAEKGVIIGYVTPGGPAAKAGLKVGDVLLKYAGKAVPDVAPFADEVSLDDRKAAHEKFAAEFAKIATAVKVGDEVVLVVERDGKPVALKAMALTKDAMEEIAAAAKKASDAEEGGEEGGDAEEAHGYVGFSMKVAATLTAKQKEKMKISATTGVLAVGVIPDSPAAKAGLKNGDVIVRYHGVEVPPLKDFDPANREHVQKWVATAGKLTAGVKPGTEVEICVEREGKVVTLKATAVDGNTMEKLAAAAAKAGGSEGDDDGSEGGEGDEGDEHGEGHAK